MARIRTIKPTIWGSKKLAGVSDSERVLAIGMISMQDDSGRFLASVTAIKGFIWPNDGDSISDAKVKRWLATLEGRGFVHLYEADGVKYGQVDVTEQRISHPQPSTIPPPPHGALFD